MGFSGPRSSRPDREGTRSVGNQVMVWDVVLGRGERGRIGGMCCMAAYERVMVI